MYKKTPKKNQASPAAEAAKVKKNGSKKLRGMDYKSGAKALSPMGAKSKGAAKFYGQGYTYRDAVKLGDFWKVSADIAVERAGSKMLSGQYIVIEHAMNAMDKAAATAGGKAKSAGGKSPATARFYKEGFTYGDAEKLAKYWGVSAGDAADLAGSKIKSGQYIYLEHAMNAISKSAPSGKGSKGGKSAEASRFYKEGFSYKDAQKLAKYWGVTPAKAADTAGGKIMNGQYMYVEHAMNNMSKGG